MPMAVNFNRPVIGVSIKVEPRAGGDIDLVIDEIVSVVLERAKGYNIPYEFKNYEFEDYIWCDVYQFDLDLEFWYLSDPDEFIYTLEEVLYEYDCTPLESNVYEWEIEDTGRG